MAARSLKYLYRRQVLCLDAKDGAQPWECGIPGYPEIGAF